MKGFGSTLVMAVAVVGFAAYVYFFEYVQKNQNEKSKEEATKVLSWTVDQITQVNIKNGRGIELKKEGNEWQLVAQNPSVKDRADNEEVQSIIEILNEEKTELVVDGQNETIDWKEFGLDKPKGVLEVFKGEEKKSFTVGSMEGFDETYYLRVGDENKVLLIQPELEELLDKKTKNLRDKRILRKSLTGIHKIVLNRKVNNRWRELTLIKKVDQNSEGNWQMIPSSLSPVNKAEVGRLMQNIRNLRAVDFVSETAELGAQKKFGLAKPEVKVEVYGQIDGEEGVWKLALSHAKGNNIFAMNNQISTIYQMHKGSGETVFTRAEEFKDKRYHFKFDKKQVAEIYIVNGQEKISLKKEEESWKVTKGQKDDDQLDQEVVGQLIDKISELEAGTYIDVPKSSMSHSIVLKNKEGQELLSLEWGKEFQGKIRENTSRSDRMFVASTNLSKERFGLMEGRVKDFGLNKIFRKVVDLSNGNEEASHSKSGGGHHGHNH